MGVNVHQRDDGSAVWKDDISGNELNRIGGPDAGTSTSPRYSGTKVVKMALAAVDTGGGILSWLNPEPVAIIVSRILVDVTTVATAACSASFGTTVVSATTSSANLIDTLDVHTATGLFDNVTDGSTNGKARQKLAVGGWVTGSKASGASAALVGNAYIHYTLA